MVSSNLILLNNFQVKKEEEHQDYFEQHPELRVAIELFFDSMVSEAPNPEESKVDRLINFFTSPDLDEIVKQKLIEASNGAELVKLQYICMFIVIELEH